MVNSEIGGRRPIQEETWWKKASYTRRDWSKKPSFERELSGHGCQLHQTRCDLILCLNASFQSGYMVVAPSTVCTGIWQVSGGRDKCQRRVKLPERTTNNVIRKRQVSKVT